MILIDDLGAPEAPVLLPDGGWLVTEQSLTRGCVTRFDAHGASRTVIATTGRPNGLALDESGRVWVAESMQRAVLRLTCDGEIAVASRDAEGIELLWPNDLCFGPDGALYFTDSGILISEFLSGDGFVDDWARLPKDGRVCRHDPVSGRTTILDRGLQFTNGIAFGLDGDLYVNETVTCNVYRYRSRGGAVAGDRELFGNVRDPEFDPGDTVYGPDGMAFDAAGRLFVTVFGQGVVAVLSRDGQTLGRIATQGRNPTNVAFGLPGSRKMHVVDAEFGRMEVIEAEADGFPLLGGWR